MKAGKQLAPAIERLIRLLAQAYVDQLEADVTQGKAPEPHHTNQRASGGWTTGRGSDAHHSS